MYIILSEYSLLFQYHVLLICAVLFYITPVFVFVCTYPFFSATPDQYFCISVITSSNGLFTAYKY